MADLAYLVEFTGMVVLLLDACQGALEGALARCGWHSRWRYPAAEVTPLFISSYVRFLEGLYSDALSAWCPQAQASGLYI